MRAGSRPRCRAYWLDRSWGYLQRLGFLEGLGDFGGEQARVGPGFLDRAGIALHFVQGAAAAGHGPERRPCQERRLEDLELVLPDEVHGEMEGRCFLFDGLDRIEQDAVGDGAPATAQGREEAHDGDGLLTIEDVSAGWDQDEVGEGGGCAQGVVGGALDVDE